jgi:hypothetical protein
VHEHHRVNTAAHVAQLVGNAKKMARLQTGPQASKGGTRWTTSTLNRTGVNKMPPVRFNWRLLYVWKPPQDITSLA